MPTTQQLLALVESPAFEQLIESVVRADAQYWQGTPPIKLPNYAYPPSPSASDTGTPSRSTSPTPTPSAN